MVSTVETIHGLLVLDGDRLLVQWRASRATDRFGAEIRTDREVDGVREVTVPLSAVAGALVRRRWWGRTELTLLAADLAAFDAIAGASGLTLPHPAEFSLRVGRADRILVEEFAAELTLALAQREETPALTAGSAPSLSSGRGTTP
jgi:hypothetical protein